MRILPAAAILALISTSALADERRDGVLAYCNDLMAGHGAFMVKTCVDQNLEASDALASYPTSAAPVIERCLGLVGNDNWFLAKVCTDRDLEAADALASQ